MSSKKIQAIYPLSFMQQSLLLHSLKESVDQGFIQVKCILVGNIDLELLKKAWRDQLNHHPFLKSSIHWENLEKPVQVVKHEVDLPLEVMDWQDLKPNVQQKRLADFLNLDKMKGLELSKSPVFRILIIRLTPSKHIMIWSCHHILLDGWSSALIIKDVFTSYDYLCKGQDYKPAQNHPYDKYLNWLKSVDETQLSNYWSDYLSGYTNPTLLGKKTPAKRYTDTPIRDKVLLFNSEETSQIKTALKQYKVTTSNLVFALWGLILSRLSNSHDVVFGTTVSGRSIDLPGIENMTGLFTNVLPVRIQVKENIQISDWMVAIQKQQAKGQNFEHASLDKITSWNHWPGHLPLFDSLVVIENFPWKSLSAGELEVTNFESGVTTTYPINIIVHPGDDLKIVVRYNTNSVSEKVTNWIIDSFKILINEVARLETETINELAKVIPRVPIKAKGSTSSITSLKTRIIPGDKKQDYLPPTSTIELQLTKIWESVLGLQTIGVYDNFFEIGGKSIQAVQLFNQINNQLGRNLSPSLLLKYPTISSLAKVWDETHMRASWSSLVPMRAGGSKPPLFAIHGGGGHVFFYQPMTQYLDSNQPVYALQPVGLDGEELKHESIEAMAAHYIKVIDSVCPTGPFSILGTCLSDPICVEINNQLRQKGKAPLALIIVDSSPFHLFPHKRVKTSKKVRWERFKERFKHNPYRTILKMSSDRIEKMMRPTKFFLEELEVQYGSDKQAKDLLSLQKQLQKLYYKYHWRPFTGKVTLIKTSQNVERINNRDENIWDKLASEGVEIIVTPGKHHTRFEEPDIIQLSKNLQEFLDRQYLHQRISLRQG